MKRKKITALIIEPRKHPKMLKLVNDREVIRNVVCKDSSLFSDMRVTHIDENIYAVSNRDAELLQLKGNRKICDKIIAGTILILETDKNGIVVDMTNSKSQKYLDLFWDVETYTDEEVNISFWNDFEETITKGYY